MKRLVVILLLAGVILSACGQRKPALEVEEENTSSEASAGEESTMSDESNDGIISAEEMNRMLGRGVNMGNALEAPAEGEWGVVIEDEYFALISEAGFDSVRIPVRWSTHALESAPYTIDAAFFDRVDHVVQQAVDNGLVAILDFHHYEEMFTDPKGQHERFLAIWKQLAEHYQDQPATVLFEILNEPHDKLDGQVWNDLVVETLAVIRETNPTRIVIVDAGQWGSAFGLAMLKLPDEDPYLIASFHHYIPFQFTHQGAEWSEGMDQYLGTKWSGKRAEKEEVDAYMQIAANWAKSHHRPMYMGEFGAYSKADMESRARWTEYVARKAEELGFSWGYWEFCAGFGVYDPVADAWVDPLKQALLPE